jgi:hypothetical protein
MSSVFPPTPLPQAVSPERWCPSHFPRRWEGGIAPPARRAGPAVPRPAPVRPPPPRPCPPASPPPGPPPGWPSGRAARRRRRSSRCGNNAAAVTRTVPKRPAASGSRMKPSCPSQSTWMIMSAQLSAASCARTVCARPGSLESGDGAGLEPAPAHRQ